MDDHYDDYDDYGYDVRYGYKLCELSYHACKKNRDDHAELLAKHNELLEIHDKATQGYEKTIHDYGSTINNLSLALDKANIKLGEANQKEAEFCQQSYDAHIRESNFASQISMLERYSEEIEEERNSLRVRVAELETILEQNDSLVAEVQNTRNNPMNGIQKTNVAILSIIAGSFDRFVLVSSFVVGLWILVG